MPPHQEALQTPASVPEITFNDGEEKFKTGRSLNRQASNQSVQSNFSEWTVTDRGEELYTLAHPPDQDLTQDVDDPLPSDFADIQLQLFKAKRHEKDNMDIRKGFFPKKALERIINEEAVVGVLTKAAPHLPSTGIQYYASKICHNSGPKDTEPSYRKMFTILLLIQQPGKIIHFVNFGLSDRDLPLESQPLVESSNIFELRRRKTPGTRLPSECFERLDVLTAGNFDGWQWTTIAPYFAKGPKRRVRLYTLSEKDIMPWIQKDKGNWGGGFSTVYRVTIHEAHHDFGDSQVSTALSVQSETLGIDLSCSSMMAHLR